MSSTSGTTEEPRPASVAILAGYATENLNLGLALRAGYSLWERLYIGGAFMFHFGRSVGEATVRVFYPSAELGYDLHIGPVTVRPYAGVGLTVIHASLGDVSASEEHLGIHPGLQIDLAVPRSPAFVGIDGRALGITGQDTIDPSIGVFFVAGSRF